MEQSNVSGPIRTIVWTVVAMILAAGLWLIGGQNTVSLLVGLLLGSVLVFAVIAEPRDGGESL